ncbi:MULTISPECIES: hypothetical protein [Bradyrhizobium]|uniref:hypothetical protein n=1 Tax=Bradyrhizobium TaxID=374 RepID=UPI001EDB4665|nr:hypothetical protein [Bradyrhizobium zhengyangense]
MPTLRETSTRAKRERNRRPFTLKASGAEFGAGIEYAIEMGWVELHESGTNVRLLCTHTTKTA